MKRSYKISDHKLVELAKDELAAAEDVIRSYEDVTIIKSPFDGSTIVVADEAHQVWGLIDLVFGEEDELLSSPVADDRDEFVLGPPMTEDEEQETRYLYNLGGLPPDEPERMTTEPSLVMLGARFFFAVLVICAAILVLGLTVVGVIWLLDLALSI